MALSLFKTVNFGSRRGSLATVGFTIYNSDFSINQSRSTDGVQEVVSASGIYGAAMTLDDSFQGLIVWDTGAAPILYAPEEFDYREIGGGSAGGIVAIGVWKEKEKEKIIGDMKKVLKLVRAISKKDNNEVIESINKLKDLQDKKSSELKEIMESFMSSDKRDQLITDVKEELDTISEAISLIIDNEEFKQIVKGVDSDVENQIARLEN